MLGLSDPIEKLNGGSQTPESPSRMDPAMSAVWEMALDILFLSDSRKVAACLERDNFLGEMCFFWVKKGVKGVEKCGNVQNSCTGGGGGGCFWLAFF